MKYHTTKDGNKIKLCDLELSHLENIIKWIEKRAIEGVDVRYGGGIPTDTPWFEAETYYGSEAKELLNIQAYKDELIRRNQTLKP